MEPQATQTTRNLLAHYTVLLNRHGAWSAEAGRFLEAHEANTEFASLAETARVLKHALATPD